MPRPGERLWASIVVGTDGSATASVAVRHAIELAGQTAARLAIVSVYEQPVDRPASQPGPPPEDAQWSVGPRAEVLKLLERTQAQAHGSGLGEVEVFARQGDAADAILDVAEELQADLIVIGHKGLTGAERFLLGSVPNKISHHAPCSVLVVRTS